MTNVIIVGAGAAGITAAISAKKHHPEFNITILEKNSILGKKILVCGAGRCNVTNTHISTNRFYGGSTKFIATILNQFNNQDIMHFLNDLGIELYEEEKNGRKKGKIFPITNQAKTVTELLESELKRTGVKIEYSTEVVDIVKTPENFEIICGQREENRTFMCDYLILACGGLTYPSLGATEFGFKTAQKFGHTIIKPVPSALPVVIEHPLIQKAAGIRIDAEVTSIINNKAIKKDIDELLFTRYGLSGPVILNISREISVRLNREKSNDCYIRINFFPDRNIDAVRNLLEKRWKTKPDQMSVHSLYGLLPNKIASFILEYLQINPLKANSALTLNEKTKLAEFLSNWILKVSATKGWNEGEFTAGGINTKEVNSTLESKIIPNLYFAGELLNVDGDVGGFNLSWAWSSGYVAGKLA